MAFNLSGLSAYVDQTSQIDLITKALLKPQTVNNLTVKAGLVSGTVNLNILDAAVDIKDAACGFGAGAVGSNSTIFTQLPIVVAAKMLKETLCPDSLYDYWLSSQLSPNAIHESVPFEAAIADFKVRSINQYVESTLWAGDGSSLDGLLFQTSVAEGAVDIAIEPKLAVWDMAALDIIVREAGGAFTNTAGQNGPFGGSGVSTNGVLHNAVISGLNP